MSITYATTDRAALRSPRALADLLDEIGMPERQLARDAGLGHATVNHLCTGRRDSCKASTAAAIERALNVPRGTVFEPGQWRP